jgi:spore maturation protein CgeB
VPQPWFHPIAFCHPENVSDTAGEVRRDAAFLFMKLVIFGLTVSSSWGNGHATLWRGLLNALAEQGHEPVFFERDVPWYADTRDLIDPENFDLILYSSWDDVRSEAESQLAGADVAMVTSYCPDAGAATDLSRNSRVPSRVFYDLDTPVTLARVRSGLPLEWAGEDGYSCFDLVLSYSGGRSLTDLRQLLGARRVIPLYGSVDPSVHKPVEPMHTPAGNRRIDLSYLGTYAQDRQLALEKFFIEPARRRPDSTFLMGGSMYPQEFPWTPNIYFVRHVPPHDHNAFYCSSDLTLNITRQPMVESGYCPSGRLFEAAACGTPVLSDWWEGLDQFFEPDREILLAQTTDDAVEALGIGRERLREIGRAARARALECHNASIRARELIEAIESARTPEELTAAGEQN